MSANPHQVLKTLHLPPLVKVLVHMVSTSVHFSGIPTKLKYLNILHYIILFSGAQSHTSRSTISSSSSGSSNGSGSNKLSANSSPKHTSSSSGSDKKSHLIKKKPLKKHDKKKSK